MNTAGLGVALGAATQEWNNQRKMAREDEAFEMQKQQHANQQEKFGWERDAQLEQKRVQDAEKALAAKYKPLFEGAAKGDYSGFGDLISAYNSQQGAFGDGHYAGMQSTPQGTVVHRFDGKGNSVGSYKLDPQTAQELLQQAYMMERSGISPAQFKEAQQYGLDMRKTRATERSADATMKNAETMEGYRQNQYDLAKSKVDYATDGTGRVLAFSHDGKLLGTYGSARPVLGHGGGGGGKDYSLNPQEQSQLRDLYTQYDAAKTEAERTLIAKKMQLVQTMHQLRLGKVPNLPGGLVNTPKDPRDPEVIKQLSRGYADAIALARTPAEVNDIQRRFRAAGLDSLGPSFVDRLAAAKEGSASEPTGGLTLDRTTQSSPGHQAVGAVVQPPLAQPRSNSELWRLNQPGVSPEAKLRILLESGALPSAGLNTSRLPR